jgi:ribonuclease HI
MSFTVFTDGASKGNPGPGGFAAIISDEGSVQEIGGLKKNTTNNEMELTAVVKALEHLPEGVEATVYTDSKYVKNGAESWRFAWRENGWKLKNKNPVANQDLWISLDDLLSRKDVSWVLVPGHSGLPANERVDEIATAFAGNKNPALYAGPLKKYSVDLANVSFDVRTKVDRTNHRARQNTKAFSYISSVKGVVKTHDSWAECEKRVKGVSGARFKKAISKSEEAHIISEFNHLK